MFSWKKNPLYKPLSQENNQDSQEDTSCACAETKDIGTQTEPISESENKEEGLIFSRPQQPNKEKLKKCFKMSKRSLKITTEAIISDHKDSSNLKKRIKVLNEEITEKIVGLDENLDSYDEVDNQVSEFLLIFAQLAKTMISKEKPKGTDETDGIVSDTISIICNLITDLLKDNIDQLSIPKPIKISLKILKRIFKLIKEKELKDNAEFTRRTETTEEETGAWEETGETSWEGGEEQRSDSGEE